MLRLDYFAPLPTNRGSVSPAWTKTINGLTLVGARIAQRMRLAARRVPF